MISIFTARRGGTIYLISD